MHPRNHLARFLFVLLAAVSPLALRAIEEEPFTLPVGFSFRISGVGNGIMTVYGEGGSPSIDFTTNGSNLESDDSGLAMLCPGRSYWLNFQASGPTNYVLSLVAPSGYQMYINGIPRDYLDVSPGGGEYSHDYSIQIRPAHGEAILDNGVFTGIDLGQAIGWELGMGTSRGGHGIGRVGFREFDLTNSPESRYRLFYTPPLNCDQINVIRDGSSDQRIRQIASPHKVMDFVDVTDGYEVRYYAFDDTTWTGSIYTINYGATPWKVTKVESTMANQLTITETEGSASRVSHLALSSGTVSSGTYVLTLLEGGPSSAWLRKTTHTSTKSGNVRENVVVVRVMNGTTEGTIMTETKYVYTTTTGLGESLTQEIADPNGSASVTTTYTYYETAPGSGSETHRGHYGRVKSIASSTGAWTAYGYYDTWNSRGQVEYKYQPHQDSPSTVTLDPTQGRVQYFTYAIDATGRVERPALKQEKINNVETEKTTWSYDNSSDFGTRIKATINAYRDASVYHSTYSEVIDPMTGNPNESGEPYVLKNPDLSQVSWSRSAGDYSYSPNYTFTVNASTGQHWRVLKVNGTTSSSGAESQSSYDSQSFASIYLVPYKSTMEVSILRWTGRPLHTYTLVYTGSGSWSSAINTVDSAYNAAGRLTSETALNGAETAYAYTNGRVSSLTGGDGVETQFTYDALGRTETVKKVGASASGIHAEQKDVTTTYDYDEADGSNYATKETISAAGTSETIVTSRAFDRAGRLIKVTPPGLSATTYSYNPSSRTQTTTAPDGGTTIQETYRDGRLKSTTGGAVVPRYFTYAVETDGRRRTQVNSGTSDSTRLQKTWVNWLGQPVKLEQPGFSQSSQAAYVEEQFYDNTTGRLTKTTRTGAAPTRYEYNTLGQVVRSGLDVNDNGLVLASSDRITDADTSFESYSSAWWLKTTTTTYPHDSSATAVTSSLERTRLTGFSSGMRAEKRATDAEGNTVTSVTSQDSGKLLTTQTTVPGLTAGDRYEYVYNGRASASTGHDGLTTKVAYDNLGRQSTTTDARSLVTTTAYYTGTALPYTVTDSASNVVSTIAYDTQGRTAWTRDAASKYTRFGYNQRSQVVQQWGDGAYPVAYTYDSTYGDRTGMSTYRGAPAADSTTWPSVGTADTTTWTFDTPSGLLWKKTDANGKYVAMDYNQAGRTYTRTLARGAVTTYGYDSATRELLTQTYSDGTPSVTYTYTRSGQTDSVADHTGTWDQVYDSSKPWRLDYTTLPSFYGTRVQTMLYESSGLLGRYQGFQLGSSAGSSADLEQAYAYSSDGRFDTLASKRAGNSVTRTFDYAYFTNTPFVAGLAIAGGHDFTVVRDYESNRNLLKTIEGKWSTTSVTRYDYTYGARMDTTTAKQSGTAFSDYYVSGSYSAVFNHYSYNARGELQTAAMYRGDTPSTTPSSADELPGRRFEYRFDSIGNRQTDGPTGDADNVDNQYTANALNQYTQKENNTVRVLGTAANGAGVSVAGAFSTDKKDRAWAADIVPANASAAVAGTASVHAAVAGGGSGGGDLVRTDSKAYFIPKGLQTFSYDDDGNLTQDSVWDYAYDAENRLTSMQHRSEVIGTGMIASADARRLEFKYDHLGRRVRKTVYDGWNGSTYSGTAIADTKYLYDGWNLIAEFDALSSLALIRSYTWGLDLNGSLTASGGVGALLQIHDYAGGGKTLLPTYDGNGNVVALLNDTSGGIEAAYEYDPFGNLLRSEGTYAASNTFRFSTKFTDTESGLIYYGHRFYAPSLGRFVNRDPIEETGGINLYGFCGNDGVNHWDYLGQSWLSKAFKSIGTAISGAVKSVVNFVADNWKPIVAVVAAVVTYGAASGAIFSTTAATATTAATTSGVLAGSVASGTISATTASVIAGAVGGAAAGVVGQVVATGSLDDVGKAALSGAIMGGVGGYFGNVQSVERVATTAVAGGVASEATGGDFRSGLITAGVQAVAAYGWAQAREFTDNNARIAAANTSDPKLRAQLQKVDSLGTHQTAGILPTAHPGDIGPNWLNQLASPVQSVYEKVSMYGQGSGRNWFEQPWAGGIDGPINRTIQAISKVHDWMNSWGYNSQGFYDSRGNFYDSMFSTYSWAAMPPATVFTTAALSPATPYIYQTNLRNNSDSMKGSPSLGTPPSGRWP